MRLKVCRVLFFCALALAGALAVCRISRGVETDLFSLVGAGRALPPVLDDLNRLSADTVRVFCADGARADALRARYPFDPPLDPTVFLEVVRTHGKGLLAPKARELLAKDELDRLRRGVKRRDYAGIGLFPKADDPYYFLNDFVATFKAIRPEGMDEGAVILTGRAGRIDAAVPEGGLLALVRMAESDDGIRLSGAPFHAALARRNTIREINALGVLSLLTTLLLGWLLFRSFRFALPMTCAVASGFLMATGAVCLLPAPPHALTFLFGTTLIGLGVDYCYHALSPDRNAPDFRNKLTGALLTTGFAFSPLLFSSVSVLRQMSVFSIVGLVTIYAFVLLFTRPLAEKDRMPGAWPKIRFAPFFYVLAGGVLLAGFLFTAHRPAHDIFSSDPTVFHKPTSVMARGEAKFASLAGDKAGFRVVNLTRWQEENAALKAKLGEVPTGAFLSAADLPSGLSFTRDGQDYMVLPEASADAIVGKAGDFVDLKVQLQRLFARFMRESLIQAGIALALLFVAALCFFRRRVLAVFLPPLGAAVMTFLTLAAWHEPITFFHVLCFFVLIGLGIDYAIFHRMDAAAKTVVFFSFLTSSVGFGLLAFTSFPVTRGMGITLASGLCWAYALSLPLRRKSHRRAAAAPLSWHEQKEQSAGRFRILLMWYVYRFLGKNAAKILFLPAYLFIYPFCRPARRALRKFYGVLGVKDKSFRHILNFAWSMLDKTDACSLCKNPPTFMLSGDTDWMKGGCFLLSTHLGCVEVMPALRPSRREAPPVHAFQQMGHDAVFTRVFAEHMDKSRLVLHAVEDIGVETAVEMQAAIRRGEIVLMAADRPSAGSKAVCPHVFLGRDCVWPKGVFRFAKMMEAPVYAIVSVKTGWNAYEIKARRLGADLLADYVGFLEENVRRYPYQWYQFYDFFGNGASV